MNCGNDCERKKELKNCLIQLDLLFQWLAAVENKPIEQDGAEMGSNFAKFKRYPEYNEFIKYACQAEEHFSTKDYNSCGNSCRFSLEAFTDYIYKKEKLEIDSGFFVLDKKTGARVLDTKNKTGYKLTTGWLNAKISSSSFQEYFRKKNAFPTRTEKTLADKFSHYEENFVYDAKGAVSILSMIYNLYAHCVDKKCFAGTPRFDISLLKNCPKELLKPQLTIEVNGKEERILQNNLLKAILSKKVSEDMIKENLSLINKTDVLGNTPLSLAVYKDDFDTVKLLLENGADPNFYFRNEIEDFRKSVNDEILKEINQNAPLKDVLKEEYKPILKDNLKKYESILRGMEEENKSILSRTGIDKILKKLKDKLEENESILNGTEVDKILEELKSRLEENKSILSRTGIDKILKELLEGLRNLLTEKVWCDYFAAHNCIPLIVAIKKDNVDIVALLLQYGAKTWDSCIDDRYEVEKIPTECSTVLACAYYYNAEECIDFLLERKDVDINQQTISGATPLMLSVENGKYYNDLLNKGARIDIKDYYRNSVFLHAVQNMRHDREVLKELLQQAKKSLNKEELKELLNHAGYAGCPISYMSEKEAKLYLEYGADVNAKNEYELSCVVDVAHLNPDMLPWFKEHGAKLDFKTFFYANSYLEPKYVVRASRQYDKKIFTEVLRTAAEYDLITSKDLDFTVPIDNIPRISPLVDAILFSKAYEIQNSTKDGKKSEKVFLSDAQLDEVYKAIASVNELSKAQRVALFERYPFTKELEKRGIDLNVPEEIESNYNTDKLIQDSLGKQINWENTPDEIMAAIKDVKSAIPYEDIEISPLDDALIAKNYDAAAIYLTNGSSVSYLTKILFLSVPDVPEKDISARNKVLVALKLRKDIDFSDVLLDLCKTHPKDDFDIAKEFINNGYNFYRFANYILSDFWCETFASGISNCDYNTYNASPSIEDVRKRNNSSFLKTFGFGETSFKDVNLRLIRKAISFGANPHEQDANPHEQDEIHKTALDYAKENGIDERVLKVRPSVQKGVICKIQSDKTDKTKIFNGQVRGTTDGRLYNFKKRIHDKNFKEVVYDDSYKEKNVFFVIQKDSKDPVHPGLADLVTLVDI